MINLVLFLIALLCFGVASAWIAENPGRVTMYWFDYRVDTSFAFLLLLSLLAACALTAGVAALFRLFTAPARWSDRRSLKRHRRGMIELTKGVAALAISDVKAADLHTKKAGKLLHHTPLTLLLSAQVARSQGDDRKTQALLEQMLAYPETEYLAARLLSDAASKQQLLPQALTLAQRAYSLNPGDSAAVAAMVSLHLRLGQWQQAMVTVKKAERRGRIDRAGSTRLQGIVYLSQALALDADDRRDAALPLAHEAVKRLKYFPPAVLLAAKLLDANDRRGRAIDLLVNAWKQAPHPDLAAALRALIARETPRKKAKLSKLLDGRILDAADFTWICRDCIRPTPKWQAHCPSCGAFDTLVWKRVG